MHDKLFRFGRNALALWLLALFALAMPAHAQTVLNPAGGSATGTLDATHTIVNYSYTVTKDEDATLTLTTDAGLRAYVEFYDADGATQLSSTLVGFGATGQLSIAHLAPGATYSVHVEVYDGSGTFTLGSSVTPPSVANDAEPNDDYQHAVTYAVNTTKTGHMGYSRTSYTDQDNLDWYSFVAPQDGDATFTLTTDSILPLRAYVEFYDSDGSTQLSNTLVGANSSGQLAIAHLAPGATYYVRVERYDGYGGYTLKNVLAPPAVANDAEPDNDPQHALAFAFNTTKTGHLGYSRASYTDQDNQDWYTITVPKDGDATYTLTTDTNLRAYVEFYDSDGSTQLGYTLVGFSATGQLVIPHLAPGTTYYVRVERYDGYGGYTLVNTEATPTITTAATPDNAPATALPFAVNGTVTGHLGYSFGSYGAVNANKWYSFVAPQDGDVVFTLTTDNALPLRAYVEFYDSDGSTQIGYTLVSNNASGQLTIGHLAPGATYYALVQRYDGYGGYTLKNALTPPTIANDKEVNDTAGMAINLHGLANFTGHLGYSRTAYGDVDNDDWYAISVSQNGDATFTLTTDNTLPLRAYVEFYDSDGTTQIGNTLVGYNTSGQLTIGHLAPGATYYVLVQRYDGYGGYNVVSSFTPVSNPINPIPGTTAATAASFAPDSSVTGNLGYSQGAYNNLSNSAWYSFIAPRDSDVTFTLATDAMLPLRAQIFFYDSDGATQIANTGVIGSNSSGQLTIGHLAPGATYYVLVQRYDGYGGYTLSNTVSPLFVTNDKEPDDSAVQATALNALANVTGHLGYSRASYTDQDNQDWYRIDLPAGNFQANIALSGSLRANFYLLAPDGATQLTSVFDGGGNAQITYNIPTAGTYYLAVTRYDGYGAYDINQPVTATVSGFLTLEGIAQSAAAQTIDVEFRPQPSGTPFTRTVSVGYNGAYFLTGIPRGKYTLAFNGAKWLRKDILNIDVNVGDATGVNALLLTGDANGDNSVDTSDFSLLVGTYGSDVTVAGSGYDAAEDFNCDGLVDVTDFGLLVGNYGTTGDL